VGGGDRVAAVEVGDRAGELEYPVVGAASLTPVGIAFD
jgi:hypothetical protein